jgi:hypothetical protein
VTYTIPPQTKKNSPYTLVAAAIAFALQWNSPAMALDHSHASFTEILQQQVTTGRVNYRALRADQAPLKRYLDTLAAIDKSEFSAWNKQQQMVYLTNLYNAATLKLIVDHYPVDSIKDIGSFFSGPWSQKVVRLFGEVITLDNVEHDILREDYQEARLHFALVCAAKGCPPLRAEAYDASRFTEQLDEQGKIYMSNSSINRVANNGSKLYLSKIFDWFSGDFVKQSGSVVAFVTPYLPNGNAISSDPTVRYSDYDWSLNNQ